MKVNSKHFLPVFLNFMDTTFRVITIHPLMATEKVEKLYRRGGVADV